MRTALPLLLLVAAPALADEKSVAALAGSYTVTEFAREGKAVPDEVRKGTSVTIDGDKLTVSMGGKEIVAKVKADAARKPAEIDLYPLTGDYEKNRYFKGVYELKGTTLTITFVEDGDRPKALDSDAKSSTRLVLEKKK